MIAVFGVFVAFALFSTVDAQICCNQSSVIFPTPSCGLPSVPVPGPSLTIGSPSLWTSLFSNSPGLNGYSVNVPSVLAVQKSDCLPGPASAIFSSNGIISSPTFGPSVAIPVPGPSCGPSLATLSFPGPASGQTVIATQNPCGSSIPASALFPAVITNQNCPPNVAFLPGPTLPQVQVVPQILSSPTLVPNPNGGCAPTVALPAPPCSSVSNAPGPVQIVSPPNCAPPNVVIGPSCPTPSVQVVPQTQIVPSSNCGPSNVVVQNPSCSGPSVQIVPQSQIISSPTVVAAPNCGASNVAVIQNPSCSPSQTVQIVPQAQIVSSPNCNTPSLVIQGSSLPTQTVQIVPQSQIISGSATLQIVPQSQIINTPTVINNPNCGPSSAVSIAIPASFGPTISNVKIVPQRQFPSNSDCSSSLPFVVVKSSPNNYPSSNYISSPNFDFDGPFPSNNFLNGPCPSSAYPPGVISGNNYPSSNCGPIPSSPNCDSSYQVVVRGPGPSCSSCGPAPPCDYSPPCPSQQSYDNYQPPCPDSNSVMDYETPVSSIC